MKIKAVILVLILLNLSACIEVRDNAEPDQAEVQTQSVEVGNLYVDGPLFLYQGEVLTEEEVKASLVLQKESDEKEVYEYQFNELRFSPEGVLYTLGKVVHLSAISLDSNIGKIATFPEGTMAASYKAGRSGGAIFLKAENAKGFLKVILRGENGGQGRAGPKPTDKLRGKNGDPVANTDCGSFPKSTSGKEGLQGFPGNKGERGGSSGKVDLEIQKNTELVVHIQKEPGHGGIGGVGGEGGAGGSSGVGSCFSVRASTGPRGSDGPDGRDGDEEMSCVKKNSQVVCN